MLRLYVYRLEDVEDDNFDNVSAIAAIEGESSAECEAKAEDVYCSNDYGYTYCELPIED